LRGQARESEHRFSERIAAGNRVAQQAALKSDPTLDRNLGSLDCRREKAGGRHRPEATASEALKRLFEIVSAERDVSALEHVQVPFATQLNDPLEILLAIALLALRPLPEIAISGLPVT
jgi:hypothetical protein